VEHTQVLAHVGLAGVEPGHNLTNVQFAAGEQRPEDCKARGIAKDAEALGDALQQVFGDRIGLDSVTV
jgi:hypothetical protein